jgi:hypothetical protein
LADAPPAWVPDGGVLAFEFDNGLGYNSRNLATTTPDSILTYTNPSAKMVYGSDGVLRYAPHNLLLQSQTFETASWTKGDATITANAVAAPDGTTTADKLVEAATLASHFAFQTTASSVTSGVTYTQTVYAKAAERTWLRVFLGANIGNGFAWINLATGAVGTTSGSPTVAVTDVGNGWYRIAVSKAATGTGATSISFLMGTSDGGDPYTGNGTSGLYLWGAQLNLGSSALTYIPTTTAAVYSLPIDHNPTTFEPLGVLIEEQRVNLLLRSQEFNDAAWTKIDLTITANSIAAPDGTITADLSTVTVASNASCYQSVTVAASTTYTFSGYLKAGNQTTASVELRYSASDNTLADAIFSLSGSGSVTLTDTGVTASIESVGNGWYRVRVTKTNPGAGLSCIVIVSTWTALAGPAVLGATLYIWGAQLEAGAFATSYVPTVASQVTRLADQVSILTSAFAYNASEGAVYQEIRCAVEGSGSWGFTDYSSATNFFGWIRSGGNGWIFRSGAGSGTLRAFDTNTGYVVGNSVKMAASYVNDLGNFQSVNGQTVVNNGPVDPNPSIPTSFNFGRPGFLSAQHIKRLTYFPTRKSNAELVVLST